ncbi:MAG TPA: DUF885 domain-containing protein, partial [Pseudoxanthomonas sp.]|nr:DUF885 domain-containing protein [Pseudoxanthomonas sp.]
MKRLLPSLLALATALLPAAPAAWAATPAAPGTQQQAASPAARLTALYHQYWEEQLKLNPVQATFQGDPRYNDLLPDC